MSGVASRHSLVEVSVSNPDAGQHNRSRRVLRLNVKLNSKDVLHVPQCADGVRGEWTHSHSAQLLGAQRTQHKEERLQRMRAGRGVERERWN